METHEDKKTYIMTCGITRGEDLVMITQKMEEKDYRGSEDVKALFDKGAELLIRRFPEKPFPSCITLWEYSLGGYQILYPRQVFD